MVHGNMVHGPISLQFFKGANYSYNSVAAAHIDASNAHSAYLATFDPITDSRARTSAESTQLANRRFAKKQLTTEIRDWFV